MAPGRTVPFRDRPPRCVLLLFRQQPKVTSRCSAAATVGFFAWAVDAPVSSGHNPISPGDESLHSEVYRLLMAATLGDDGEVRPAAWPLNQDQMVRTCRLREMAEHKLVAFFPKLRAATEIFRCILLHTFFLLRRGFTLLPHRSAAGIHASCATSS